MYLHHASELLSKIYHTSDMFRILAGSLNHYTVVYGLNFNSLKDSVPEHQGAQWKMMEYCFRDIHNNGAGFERAKGYCRAKFNTPEASMITEVKTLKEPGLSYKCRGPHFKNSCTNFKGKNSNKFQSKTSTQQNYKEKTAHINFVTMKRTAICSLQEPYHFKHPNKLGQVMICWKY